MAKGADVKEAVFELGFGPKVDAGDGGRTAEMRGTLSSEAVGARLNGAPTGLRSWFGGKRTRRLHQLLEALAKPPAEYQPTDTLAKATGLENVVYPLLADLSRRGWVEHRWLETPQGPRLAYRLSPRGAADSGIDPLHLAGLDTVRAHRLSG